MATSPCREMVKAVEEAERLGIVAELFPRWVVLRT
jgi:hypothetical protein